MTNFRIRFSVADSLRRAPASKARMGTGRSGFGGIWKAFPRDSSVASQKFLSESGECKSRFFAHHPQTEKRLGPRSLRMTAAIMLGESGTELQGISGTHIDFSEL